MKPRVLVICENLTTSIRVVPVYKQLLSRGKVEPILFTTFGEPAPLALFEKEHINYLTVRDVINDDDRAQLTQLKETYREIFDAAREHHSLDTCRYKGVPMLPFIGDEVLKLNQMKIFCHYVFRKLAARFDPSLVFTGYCSGGKKKQYVTMANRMGIPTLHLQYGANILPKGTSRRELFSKNYCVWGDVFTDLYVDKEDLRERTLITGDPVFDEYAAVDPMAMSSALGISPEKRVVMIGICFASETLRVVEDLKGVQLNDDTVYIFKLHPALANKKEEIESTLSAINGDIRVVGTEVAPYELFHIADHYVVLEQESLWLTAFHFNVVPTVVDSYGKFSPEEHPLQWLLDAGGRIDSLAQLPDLDLAVSKVELSLYENAKRRLWHVADYKAGPRVAAMAEGLAFGKPFQEIQKEVEALS